MSHKTRTKLLIALVIIILIVAHIIHAVTAKYSIDGRQFIELMDKLGYTTYNYENLDEERIKNLEMYSTIQNFDDRKKPRQIYYSQYGGGRTEVRFTIYNEDTDAVEVEKWYEVAQQLNLTSQEPDRENYLIDAKSATSRKGDNYQRYYTKVIDGDYMLVSQIDNTLLVAKVDPLDIEMFNKEINKIGY